MVRSSGHTVARFPLRPKTKRPGSLRTSCLIPGFAYALVVVVVATPIAFVTLRAIVSLGT
jgi:hypothetical protein